MGDQSSDAISTTREKRQPQVFRTPSSAARNPIDDFLALNPELKLQSFEEQNRNDSAICIQPGGRSDQEDARSLPGGIAVKLADCVTSRDGSLRNIGGDEASRPGGSVGTTSASSWEYPDQVPPPLRVVSRKMANNRIIPTHDKPTHEPVIVTVLSKLCQDVQKSYEGVGEHCVPDCGEDIGQAHETRTVPGTGDSSPPLAAVENQGPVPKRRRVTFAGMVDVREIQPERTTDEPAAQEQVTDQTRTRFAAASSAAIRSLREYAKPPDQAEIKRRNRANTVASNRTERQEIHRARRRPLNNQTARPGRTLDRRPRLQNDVAHDQPRNQPRYISQSTGSSTALTGQDQSIIVSNVREQPKCDTEITSSGYGEAPTVTSSSQHNVQPPVKRSESMIKSLARKMSGLGLRSDFSSSGIRPTSNENAQCAETRALVYARGEFVSSSRHGMDGPPRLDFVGCGPGA